MDHSIRTRAEQAFRDYLEQVRSGSGPDPQEFAAQYPAEVAGELHRILDDYAFLRADLQGREEGRVLGDYRLVREIGQGGMGVVWEAEQRSLGRRVALKILHPHLGIQPRWIDRFQREAQAGGRLSHPGIVAVHAVGEEEGTHFIVQELVEGGRTLADRLQELEAEEELPAGYYRGTAELFAQIADALEAAHEAGVVHRDIKPANVLLSSAGPKIADFGVARIQEDLALSRSGEFLGTPYYMSPEQVASRRLPLDHRSDVFSLGATLYEALSLVRPFQGDTSQQIAEKIMLEDPPDPRRLRSRVPRELAVIALKALEKSPGRRYSTAADFAADLRRFLADEPIRARPPGPLARSGKWLRRHPAVASAVAVAAAAFVAITLLFFDARSERARADEAAGTARAEAATAERVVEFLVGLFEVSDPTQALGRTVTAFEILQRGVEKIETELLDEPAIRASLLLVMGRVYRRLNLNEEAGPLLERALALSREAHGNLDRRTFAALNQLGTYNMAMARYPEAEAAYREAQEGHEAVFGADAPASLENQGNLAYVYFAQDRLKEAEPLLRASFEGSRQLHGDDHPITVSAQSNLTGLLIKQGKTDEAIEFGTEVLARLREVYEPEHPALLSHLHAMGHLCRRLELYADSERYYLEAYEANLRVHGPQHSYTLNNQSGLGQLYYRQERWQESEVHLLAAVAGRRALSGTGHPSTRSAMSNLAWLYLRTERLDAAEALALELLESTPEGDSRRQDRLDLLERIRAAREAAGGGR